MYKRVDYENRECNWCCELYKPKTSHQNFCSKNCYRRYGKKFLGHSHGSYIPSTRDINNLKTNYRSFKEASCSYCGFVALDPCQLDVDHTDGNHFNNEPSNLQTLCANCHRLKTKINFEGPYSKSPRHV